MTEPVKTPTIATLVFGPPLDCSECGQQVTYLSKGAVVRACCIPCAWSAVARNAHGAAHAAKRGGSAKPPIPAIAHKGAVA